MTQTTSLINLVLTPMSVSQAIPSRVVDPHQGATDVATTAVKSTELVISPGVPSQLLVQLRNTTDAPLQVDFRLEGDFPETWCQVGTEGSDILPGQQMEGVLYFAIAPDFFERPLAPEQLPLKLDYTGQLTILVTHTRSGYRQVDLHQFKLYVRPDSLYPTFLPAIYRQVDFIGRFLKIFEATFEPTVNTLDSLWAYLDPLTAPEALLPFLAHWVGWEFQGPLRLQQQRLLIRHALQIYRWRGTRRGLRFYLHLATGLPLDEEIPQESAKHIGIHENFTAGCITGSARLGQDAILGGSRPLHFLICLRPPAQYPLDESLIRQIIQQEKPAFCTYELRIERRSSPLIAVGDPP
jgi:phage tail-like protein